MREQRADVVVIGGGPAGSTAAALLRSYDPTLRVVLVERESFPRHHVGESTLPDANGVLHKLGVLPKIEAAGFQRKTGITYRWRRDRPAFTEVFARGVHKPFAEQGAVLPDHAWQVDRARYDALLLDHARERGVEVWQPCTARRILRDDDRVYGVVVEQAGQPPQTILCPHLVDASGQGRVLGRELGVARQAEDLGDLAIYRYYADPTWPEPGPDQPVPDRIFFAATSAGWIWLIPLSSAQVSVGLVTKAELSRSDHEALFEAQLDEVPELGALLASARRTPPPEDPTPGADRSLRVQNWSYQHERLAGPGWYLAGDAAAFVDPILSSGILLAHRAGLTVANAVMTERRHPEIDPAVVREAYGEFYRDLCGGFLQMARWWYGQRDTELADWWAQAGVLARARRASSAMDDIDAFMLFAAGYTSDFRFTHIGPGFGGAGLECCVVGLTGNLEESRRLRGGWGDGRRVIERGYARVELERYLATYVETDRWWWFPRLRVWDPSGESRVFHPPAPLRPSGSPDEQGCLIALEAILDAADGTRGVLDVIEHARHRLRHHGRDEAAQDIVPTIVADLTALEILVVNERHSLVGRGAAAIDDRQRELRRRYVRVELGWEPAHQLSEHGLSRLPCASFLQEAQPPVRYLPPLCVRPDQSPQPDVAMKVLGRVIAAVERGGSLESIVQAACRDAPSAWAKLQRDLANVIAFELVSCGVLELGQP